MEKYMVLQWSKHLEFKDSLQFMNCSLAELTNNLAKSEEEKFPLLRNLYPEEEKLKLLLRKGVYPYDCVDDWKKMDATELPDRKEFFNVLRNEDCSQEDWNHAFKVWNTFDCKSFQEYHDLYLKSMLLYL